MNNDDFSLLRAIGPEDADRLSAAARDLSEKTGLSFDRAAEAISKAFRELCDALKTAIGSISAVFAEVEEEFGALYVEPRARRRKQDRDQARIIEQRFRAEIKQLESQRIVRRIYKPP